MSVLSIFAIQLHTMKPKERILEVAFRLFHQQGYNSTGINQIIAEAAVAKASFYHHFKSKEDLCIAFLDVRHDYWLDALHHFISAASTPSQKVLTAFDFLIHMNQKENFRGCSFLNILSEIPSDNTRILKVIQEHKNDLRLFFTDLLDTPELSDHIYLLFESSIIESQMFKSNELIHTSKNIVTRLIA